jgi:hypothetical protein
MNLERKLDRIIFFLESSKSGLTSEGHQEHKISHYLFFLFCSFLGGHSFYILICAPLIISSLAAWASQFHETKSLYPLQLSLYTMDTTETTCRPKDSGLKLH